jgi:hypothetical protein
MTNQKSDIHTRCPYCQIGQLKAQSVLFFDQGINYPIVGPNFPGLRCDLCGERFFDPVAIRHLQAMIWIGQEKQGQYESPQRGHDQQTSIDLANQRRRP